MRLPGYQLPHPAVKVPVSPGCHAQGFAVFSEIDFVANAKIDHDPNSSATCWYRTFTPAISKLAATRFPSNENRLRFNVANRSPVPQQFARQRFCLPHVHRADRLSDSIFDQLHRFVKLAIGLNPRLPSDHPRVVFRQPRQRQFARQSVPSLAKPK